VTTKVVLKNCQVVVNGVNFSDHVDSVEIMMKKKAIDTTNFSGGGTEVVAGLKNDSFVISFQQDFSPAEVNATLYPLYNNETEFTVAIRPVTAAISTSNPEYSATCVLLEYQPLSGKVGDLSVTKTTFNAQRSGIAMATS
jgi:hypothetical protein